MGGSVSTSSGSGSTSQAPTRPSYSPRSRTFSTELQDGEHISEGAALDGLDAPIISFQASCNLSASAWCPLAVQSVVTHVLRLLRLRSWSSQKATVLHA